MEKDTESMAKGISCTETESIDTEIKSSTICIPDHDRCHNDNTVGEILQKYDWHELESKFEEAMTGHCQAEELLQKETSSLLEVVLDANLFLHFFGYKTITLRNCKGEKRETCTD